MTTKSSCCSCTGTLIMQLVALGLVVGIGGYIAYNAITKKIEEQNP